MRNRDVCHRPVSRNQGIAHGARIIFAGGIHTIVRKLKTQYILASDVPGTQPGSLPETQSTTLKGERL